MSPAPLLVPMLMMAVWRVGVGMAQPYMRVAMRMRLAYRIGRLMPVTVMGIVPMAMFVRHRFVFVVMLVAFGQMQPHA